MRKLLFRMTKWLVFTYFKDGLSPVHGSGEASNRIIAWRWTFYDEEWEKEKGQ